MVRMSIIVVGALASLLGGTARAETITEFLREFHADPARMMQKLPGEVDASGAVHSRGYIKEDAAGWANLIHYRESERARLMPQALITAPTDGPDTPDLLIEAGTNVARNIYDISGRSLHQATVPVMPWTDSYWPLQKGNTANRYSDPSNPKSRDWTLNYSYAQSNPASSIVASGDSAAINRLSPAEKYDLVMGDSSYSLTRYAWRTGQALQEKMGSVPGWMGICHGWAGASHMQIPVTKQPVQVTAANGTSVTFFPQDVKALNSMLWANSSPRVRFAGRRCNVPSPPRNAYGRIIDKGCFDVNPATWHLGIVNQLGQNKRSVVMDATYDVEVWNHPVASYRFRYFNPQTWKESVTPEASVIPLGNFSLDKFREFRSPEAKSVVGIFMDVTYVVEINPVRVPYEPVPPVKTLRFIYDLELDGTGTVIGGEWYSNAHPDFVWTHDATQQARTPFDSEIAGDAWTPSQPVPASWAGPAANASSRGAPLATFLSRLIQGEPPVNP